MRNVIPTAVAIIKDNLRSRVTLGFVIVFPLILAFIFSLLGQAFQPHVSVYVAGEGSEGLASYLNQSRLFTAYVGGNVNYVKLNDVIFVNTTSKVIYYNQLMANYVPVLKTYISSYYLHEQVPFTAQQTITKSTPVAYEISGVVGVIALSNGMFGVTGVGSGYYRDKLVERLASSPIRDYEWVLALMIYEVVITIISTLAILIVGALMGFLPDFGLTFLAGLILGTLMFSGLGAVILGLTPKEKIVLANIVANFLVLPLMFISNAFFSPSIFPSFLRLVAEYQPVSILNDIVRDTLVLGEIPNPVYVGTIFVLTLVFLGVGSRLLRLREV
ncbi:ABC transporter permease [Stygiolobus caldivivus]|uniref:ABC transporter n=1 Tax=Stygiolobus caldivivus TaxID=2824673 RepID=A0A8D5ZI50_9CREN|nr:ABC transporter permease [Stygiolobus caldivivus]BCU68972.1 ABC transporter [Stygiolobus caldivivus]